MKAIILIPANMSKENGITIRSKCILSILKSKFDVKAISNKNDNFSSTFNIMKEILTWNFKLIYFLLTIKADFLYCCSDFLGFLTYFPISKLMHTEVIFEAHGILSEENKSKKRPYILIILCEILERFVIGNSDYVIALSQDIFSFYKKYNDNISLIPVFVDESIYFESTKPSSKSKTVGLIGPFSMPANKYYLEYLYTNVEKFLDKIEFVIIGKCDNRISHPKLTYTGYIDSRKEYIGRISSLDLLLVPSKVPTSGPLTKILEAMACSIPVFTTPNGILGLDYVTPGADIFVSDENELTNKINNNIYKMDLMTTIGKNARKLIEENYSKRVNEAKIFEVIKKVMQNE